MPRKASSKAQLCGCLICGFIDWIGGVDGHRVEHDEHAWYKENGYANSYGCFDCFNLYNARRIVCTKADRTGTSSDCLYPHSRSSDHKIKPLFADVSPSRISTPAKKVSSSSSNGVKTSARDAMINHDLIVKSTIDLLEDACPPTDDESSDSSSSSDDGHGPPYTQSVVSPDIFETPLLDDDKEEEKEKPKDRIKERDKKRERQIEKEKEKLKPVLSHSLYKKPSSVSSIQTPPNKKTKL